MDDIWAYITCFSWIPWLIMGLLGLFLGWLLFRGKKQVGDLSVEGEGALRAEADSLRARINELEGNIGSRDSELSDLRTQLAAAPAVATATSDDDETYALEWRNRYLAARVKYLEGRIAEAPAPKKAAPKKAVAKKKPAPKKAAPKKAAKPKVLYDAPTEGKPDDLKLISGVGPKLEKLLNKNGVYYFRQVANWNKGNVKMVNDKLDAFPGRIERDEWVRQAKGLAKGSGAKPAKAKAPAKKAPAKKAPAKKAANPNAKYLENVRKFDAKANSAVVDNIVKYCGVALRSRDASLVACSDEKEKNRVAKGFCTKKLGLKSGQDKLVSDVCEQMKSQRFKNRVTFYYLAAKKAGKLSVFK